MVSGEIGSCSKRVEVRCAAVVDDIFWFWAWWCWGGGGACWGLGAAGPLEEGGAAPRAFAICCVFFFF